MKITKKMQNVIAELEYIIGSKCYNPNSYDGWSGIEGQGFRYPVNIPDENGEYIKVRANLNESVFVSVEKLPESSITHMKYKFGSNELHIGKGLVAILEYLERRYNLNFIELEGE